MVAAKVTLAGIPLQQRSDLLYIARRQNICAPREVKFIREIPKLGTGKVNHRELQKLV